MHAYFLIGFSSFFHHFFIIISSLFHHFFIIFSSFFGALKGNFPIF